MYYKRKPSHTGPGDIPSHASLWIDTFIVCPQRKWDIKEQNPVGREPGPSNCISDNYDGDSGGGDDGGGGCGDDAYAPTTTIAASTATAAVATTTITLALPSQMAVNAISSNIRISSYNFSETEWVETSTVKCLILVS